ncbi:tripartite tricarboxylate transporter substrate binding protein [Rothia nasimurium]|uniref:tripartite tricarboxylate transporter substrate binding protein n=1 Tax=Rothia nasimurium TaxID=85336 RepID=UPI001F34CB78|nr:tripartite tricarboxylate transporter substrate binding protein [Rothia nasimurium]
MFKKILALLLLAVFLTGCTAGNRAYPSKKIEIIVAFGPGGAPDTVARSFAASLEEVSGATVLVSNHPGAMGIIGTTKAAMSANDGYTLFLAPIASFTSAPLLQEVHYSSGDFEGVVALSQQAYAISVAADSSYNTLEDLASISDITYATMGIGHHSHVLMAEILAQQGSAGRAVPFDGSANGLQSVVAHETQVAITDANTAVQRARSGETRILAVTGSERNPSLPDVPTVTELGYPEADYTVSQALAIPQGVDPEILNTITELAQQAVETESYQAFLSATNNRLPEMSGDEWLNIYAPAELDRTANAYERLRITS